MRNNIFSALTVLLALVPALASADGGCRQFVGVGTTQATGPESFAGTATSNLGDAAVDVAITGIKPIANGSLLATTRHTIATGPLVISTSDRARLIQVNDFGLYRLDTQALIVEGGWGHLKIDGIVNLWTGAAQWFVEGRVCSD